MKAHKRVARRRAYVAELASLGLTMESIARALDAPYFCIGNDVRVCQIEVRRAPHLSPPLAAAARNRASVMAALYREGYTLQQIGDQYKLTRERVRQIINKHFRMTAADGGKTRIAEQRRQAARDQKEARYLRKHGCTVEQHRLLLDIGKRMVASGRGSYQQPTYAFRQQRQMSKFRGIGWELTLWQWWTVWQQSGHWEQRGRGQGYVMCRHGDVGPYALGNVFIAKATENSSEGQNRKKLDPSLPIGVTRTGSGRYLAHRNLNGKSLRLGTYDTPELAHAAYLMAAPQMSVAA